MRVIGRDVLDAFCTRHGDARSWIEAWLQEVERASWVSPQSVKDRYASVSFLPENVLVFNVKGNRYRLETRIAYRHGIVMVLWAGTHRDYDDRNRRR